MRSIGARFEIKPTMMGGNDLDNIAKWIADQEGEMIALLERVVNIDSGSHDKLGVDEVGEVFAAFFESHGIRTEWEERAERGNLLRTRRAGAAPVVLLGHRDTVFKKGEAARRPFTIREGRAFGPGVADMKGGLVVNAFVKVALDKAGLAVPVDCLLTSDEEIGSSQSRSVIEEMARDARAVFNSEPGRVSGNVVSSRKGGIFMSIGVEGVPAHAGINFEVGRSAIHALAAKVGALASLTDLERGTTVNVGLISGGATVNTVAPRAEAGIDIRFQTIEERNRVLSEIERIALHPHVPDTRCETEIQAEFLPLEKTQGNAKLLAAYLRVAREMGLPIGDEFTGGCADSGFTSAVGAPTLCGTGPVGGKAHTPEEYIELDTLVVRTQVMASTVAAL
jgi:glutamate carboxypeptidase